jgi:predicted O-methyltransferase YrrM
LISLEIDPGHADVARRNLERARVADRVQILVAPAVDSLARLAADHVDPFDLVFIDADKVNSDVYFRAALGLSHVGTVLVVDNVVRKGEVIDAQSADGNIQGIRRFTELLASEPRVSATAIQTVGTKGYDGLVLAVVTSPLIDDAPQPNG